MGGPPGEIGSVYVQPSVRLWEQNGSLNAAVTRQKAFRSGLTGSAGLASPFYYFCSQYKECVRASGKDRSYKEQDTIPDPESRSPRTQKEGVATVPAEGLETAAQ